MGSNRKFTQELEEAILHRCGEGLPVNKIAKEFGCCRNTLITLIKRNNAQSAYRPIYSKETEAEILQKYIDGITAVDLAKEYGFCLATVRKIIERSDVHYKSRSELLGTLHERFWQRVIIQEGCWGWKGSQPNGYGYIKLLGKIYYAHRLSYEIHFGAFDKRLSVIRECKNKLCCNPEHLLLETKRDIDL